jgi:16S rRNA (cytosine1402-N4)-methyltransferase
MAKSGIHEESPGRLSARVPFGTPRTWQTVVAGARKQGGRQKLHPATKTFLALRIAVNREMEELEQFLTRTPATLSLGGRWVVLAYHSLEDRQVKHRFQQLAREAAFRMLTKKPIVASESEVAANPRARSAKMRVVEKIAAEKIELEQAS